MRRTGRSILLFILCLSACSGGGPAGADGGLDGLSGGQVACGDKTCQEGEYCLIQCQCCGVPIMDGGPQPSASYSCKPIPAGCSMADFCACRAAVGSNACERPRSVLVPCA